VRNAKSRLRPQLAGKIITKQENASGRGRFRVLKRFGGCGQDNVVGPSRTQFLADVGFKLRERRCVWRQVNGKRCATSRGVKPQNAVWDQFQGRRGGGIDLSFVRVMPTIRSGGAVVLPPTPSNGSDIWILGGSRSAAIRTARYPAELGLQGRNTPVCATFLEYGQPSK
jgi:hypothetical protein